MALPAGALTATITVGAPIDIAGTAGTLVSLTVRHEVPAGLVWAATGDMIEPWSASPAAGESPVTSASLEVLADQPGVLTSSTVDGAARMVEIRSWPLVATWVTRQSATGAPTRHVRRFAAPAPGTTVDLDMLPQEGALPPAVITSAQTINIGGTGIDAEGVQDVVGAMVTAAGGTYDDAAGTITLPDAASDSRFADLGTHTGGPLAIDADAAQTVRVVLAGDVTVGLSGGADGSVVTAHYQQDTIGGRAITHLGTVMWAGDITPTLSTAANRVDVITYQRMLGEWVAIPSGIGFRAPAASDTTSPTAPTSLAQSAQTETTAAFTWTAATDNVAVDHYEWSTDGATWATTGLGSTTGYTLTGLSEGGTFYVRAVDTSGNLSPVASVPYSVTATVGPDSMAALSGWWDASDAATITLVAGDASAFASKGSKAWTPGQANAAYRPTPTTVNGLGALQFAASDRMTSPLAGGASYPFSSGVTVWVVARYDGATGYAWPLQGVGTYSTSQFRGPNTTYDTSRPALSSGQVFLAAYTYSADGTVRLYADGVASTGAGIKTGQPVPAGLLLSMQDGSTQGPFTFCEGGVHEAVLTAGDIANLHAYAQVKWGCR